MKIENPVLNEIIQIIETNDNWRSEKSGNKGFGNFQKIYKKDNSEMRNCVEEVIRLQENNYIEVEWYQDKVEPTHMKFSLEKKNLFYEMAGITPKEQRIAEYSRWVQQKLSEARKGWIRNYYEKILKSLEKGKISKDLEENYEPIYQTENAELFQCLDELNLLDELTYVRVFSKKVFHNSKKFEKTYKKKIISRMNEWGEEGFFKETPEKDILRLMNLDDYSTTLSVKGALCVKINGEEINYSKFSYGCDINTKMLEEMEILKEQKIKKVITVENKANFVSMPMEEETLIIFTHGFLAPLECKVLKELEAILPEETKYYHTGDLDLGGIRIFKFIKNSIFSKLEPMNMDAAIYEKYLSYGEVLDAKVANDYWKKVEKEKCEPFVELIDKMLENKLIIEQEAFLIKE